MFCNSSSEREVLLYTFDKHTPESHSVDHSSRGLKLQQQAAVQAAVRMHPMASSTDVRRNLHLVEKKRRDENYISPSKKRTVQREVAKERRKVLSEFTNGEQIDRTEGSLTRMSASKSWLQSTTGQVVRISSFISWSASVISSKKRLGLPMIQLHSFCCMRPAPSIPSGR